MNQNTNYIDTILNAPHEDLVAMLEQETLGNLSSIKNFFIMLYETNKMLKDAIIKKIQDDELDPKEADGTLNDMYVMLQNIEDVVAITNEVIKSKTTTLTSKN